MAEPQNDGKGKKAFKAGDEVQVVLGDGKLATAKIASIDKDGKASLVFEHRGERVEITGSAFDEAGKKADCWCGPPAAGAGAEQK